MSDELGFHDPVNDPSLKRTMQNIEQGVPADPLTWNGSPMGTGTNVAALGAAQFPSGRGNEALGLAEQNATRLRTKADDILAKQHQTQLAYEPQIMDERNKLGADLKAGERTISMPAAPKLKPEEITPVFGALMVFAALAGKGARNHAVGALNAMNGVMEGSHQGNKEMYDRSMKRFEVSMKEAVKAQEAEHKRYESILTNDKWNIEQKQEEMRLEMLKNGDYAGADKMAEQGMTRYIQTMYQTEAAKEKASEHAAKLVEEKSVKEKAVKDREEARIRKEFTGLIAPYRQMGDTTNIIVTNLDAETPFGDQIVQNEIRKLSQAQGTNLQVEMARSFGSLYDRIGGHFAHFIEGKYSDDQRKQIKDALLLMDKQYIQPKINEYANRFRKVAESSGVDPENVIYMDGYQYNPSIAPAPSNERGGASGSWGDTVAPPSGGSSTDDLVAKLREKHAF